ncbi:MAG TPA: hypothetical protein VND19_24225 [Acetobacteraceae bacterium]|nr:hypothetical protein [Acetobacteraceae bacterium]
MTGRADAPPNHQKIHSANALTILAARTNDTARAAETLDRMRGAADRQAGNTYRLPIAEQRISEIEAALAALRS